MTLTTRVRILTPLPIDRLWAECQRLIDAPSSVAWDDSANEALTYPGGRVRRNDADQGLPALMWIHYAIERPLEVDADDGPAGPGPFFAEVAFDTGYGSDNDSETCGQLHARLVAELDAWLEDSYGIEATWQYEYEGTWHPAKGESLALLASW